MATLIRHTAVWTGPPGLPGYSQFYQSSPGDIASQAQVGHDDVQAMFDGLSSLIPEEITITVSPVYQLLDMATGALVGEGTVGTASDAVAGSMVGGWNAQVGVLVEWLTGAFVSGSRVRGRTYLVPLGSLSDANGTLPEATLAGIRSVTYGFASLDHDFVVWHRPVGGTGGVASVITGAVVRDHVAILRSRML